MSSSAEYEAAYKQAVMNLSRLMPQLIQTMEHHTKAMEELSRSIRFMPTTVHLRP